jgi:hypothetical protein
MQKTYVPFLTKVRMGLSKMLNARITHCTFATVCKYMPIANSTDLYRAYRLLKEEGIVLEDGTFNAERAKEWLEETKT